MKLFTLATFTVAIAFATVAQAHEHLFQAHLTGAVENIPNGSFGIGTSTLLLDLDLITLDVEILFSGLTGTSTASFLFGPTEFAGSGIAGAMLPALSSTGFPVGVTAGTYEYHFDLVEASSYDPAFVTASGGTISGALNALVAALEDGKAYVSIQSSSFPSGEIRGFFTEVPEPFSFALLGVGAAGLMFIRPRR